MDPTEMRAEAERLMGELVHYEIHSNIYVATSHAAAQWYIAAALDDIATLLAKRNEADLIK